MNYKGKLDHMLTNKDIDLGFTKKVADELKTTTDIIQGIDGESREAIHQRSTKKQYKRG